MVKIRLKRAGKKKKPFYSVVASDSRFPRDGRFIEKIGTYDPFTKKTDIKIDKYEKWIKNGAKCTATVESIIKKIQNVV